MYMIVEQVGIGSRIILNHGWMAKIGIEEVGTQVMDVRVEGDALVIRRVPAELRAAAMEKAEATSDKRKQGWQGAIRETIRESGGQSVEPA